MALPARYQCYRPNTGAPVQCYDFENQIMVPWSQVENELINGEATVNADEVLEGTFILANEIHYGSDGAGSPHPFTSLTADVFSLGTGMRAQYSSSRNSGIQFNAIPDDANYAVVEVISFEARYSIDALATSPIPYTATALRDNGNKASDGDRIILRSRREIESFKCISQGATLTTPDLAMLSVTFYQVL